MNKDPYDQPLETRDIFGQFNETVPQETPMQRPVVKEQPIEQPVVAPQEKPGFLSLSNLREINKALEVGAARGFSQEWFDEYLALQPAIKKYVESGFSLDEAKKAIAEELPKIREQQKALEEAHPYATGVGKFVGSIPPMLAAPVGKGAKWLYDVGYGGLFGGLAGAGEAEEDKLTSGAWGAGLGAGTTAAFLGAGAGLKAIYDRTLKPIGGAAYAWLRPQAAAEKKLINTLIQDQQDIAAGKLQGIDWDQWTKLRDNGEPVTIADLGGPRTQALIKDLVKNDPEKAAQLTRFFEDRFKTQYERIGNDIRYITGSEANAGKTSDQILAEYDAKRFPAYQKAYSNPNAEFMYDKELQNYVNSFKDPKGSSKFISDAIQNGYDEAVKQAVFNNRPRPEYYSLEHWDYIRREISKNSGAWKKAEELNKILDAKVPEYKEARGLVTNYFGEKNALEAGQRFAEKKIRIEDLQKTLRKMSPEELELFREGYASNLSNNVIKNIKEGVDVNNALFGKPAQKEQLLVVFGEEGLNKIKDRMAVESIYQNTNKAFKIPASSYKDFILAGLTGGAISGYESGWDPNFIIGGVSAGALFKKAIAQEMTKRGVKFLNRESADILSRLLTSQDPADMRKAYDLLSKNPQARTALQAFSNAMQRATALATSKSLTEQSQEKELERAPWLQEKELERAPWLQGKARGGSVTDKMHMAKGGFTRWTPYDKTWNSLNPYQKAAVMALMEADSARPEDAKNILGAMVNRATRSKEDLGTHVSKAIYQPTFEPSQRARLGRLLQHPAMPELTAWAQRRSQGLEPDIVGGATHYLAHEPVMLALQRKQPKKYRSWVQWTKFNPETKTYGNVTMRDKSHAFLAPEGKFSAPYVAPQQVAGEVPPILQSQTRQERDRAQLAQMAENVSRQEIPPILQSQTHENRARLAQMAAEAAQPTQTAAVPETKKELSSQDYAKFLQALQGFMKGEEELPVPPAPSIAPPQASRPEIPIAMPYGRAQGGSVTDKMHRARKKKVDGGAATNDNMTWGDVAEQYKKNIGPDVKRQVEEAAQRQKAGLLNPIGSMTQAAQTVLDLGKGAYDFGTKAYDVGVGLGSKALGTMGYNPTGDVKYHREQALDELLGKATEQNLKKYIVENPAEATATIGSLGLGTAALGRKVLTSPLAREFIANQEGSLNLGKLPGMGHNMPPETIEAPKRQLKEGLYSALDESFNQTDRKRGIPAAWRNEFRRQGVSDSEMKWRGLNDFFANKPGNQDITRDEIQSFLQNKQITPTTFVKTKSYNKYQRRPEDETTSEYLKDRPWGGRKYLERITELDENVLPENQEWFRAGGPHPDEGVKKPVGWTLEETNDDLLGRGEGQVIHEIQSPHGQKLAGKQKIQLKTKEQIQNEIDDLEKIINETKHFADQRDTLNDIPYDLTKLNYDQRETILKAYENSQQIKSDLKNTEQGLRNLKNQDYYRGAFDDRPEVLEMIKQFEDKFETLKQNEEVYNKIIDSFKNYLKPVDENKLNEKLRIFDEAYRKRSELESELYDYDEPVSPAPFVDINSGFNTLFQKSLIDAAKSGKEWLAVSGPKRIKERWNEDASKMYERKTTDVLRKLAKQHDPKAQIETFYPYPKHGHKKYSPEEWKAENGEPYYGIRITPEMRKSILEKGFKMMSKGGSVTEKMKLAQACWKGYKAVGVKIKKGKTVPNCVPVKKKKNG